MTLRPLAVLVLISLTGLASACAQPVAPPIARTCANLDRLNDLSGRFVHQIELADGTVSEPVEVFWAHEETSLLALAPSGEGGPRLDFEVAGRVDTEPEEPSGACDREVAEDQGPALFRSDLRVVWTVERSGASVAALLGEDVVPSVATERAPVARGFALDGRLSQLDVEVDYVVESTGETVTARHSLSRVR